MKINENENKISFFWLKVWHKLMRFINFIKNFNYIFLENKIVNCENKVLKILWVLTGIEIRKIPFSYIINF